MRVADLAGQRVAVWGLGREGLAAIRWIRSCHPDLPLLLIEEKVGAGIPEGLGSGVACVSGAGQIAAALDGVDVVVKSPGVSLYRREIVMARERGTRITSLLNLWFAEPRRVVTICVTGTKGKSTTASLLAHMLDGLGQRVSLAGNIGVAVTGIDPAAAYAVIEVSSYQAADFDGLCDIAVLTSLYPEHLDWHLTVENYYRDKMVLLRRSRCSIASRCAEPAIAGLAAPQVWCGGAGGIHPRGDEIFDGDARLGRVGNPYLARPHNLSNLCAALAALKALDIAPARALDAVAGFCGLRHRQQELGSRDGVLYVDDSISTIPESTIAALRVYAGREVAVLLGGHDRGVDYSRLVAMLARGAAAEVICLGASGERIFAALRDLPKAVCGFHRVASMAEAVLCARRSLSAGGVVLLSPAAPSYGSYRDFTERGRDFAAKSGFADAAGGR